MSPHAASRSRGVLSARSHARAGARNIIVAAVVSGVVVSTAVTARADVVTNNVVAGGTDTIVPGGSTSIGYTIAQSNTTPLNDASGCNATGSAPATITPSAPSGVTVSPASGSVIGCNNLVSFSFGAATAGDYLVQVSVSGGKSGSRWDTSGATWTLHVHPANTAPVVTVGGVADGASYEKGSVPTAVCNVTDAEDGNSTFAATVGAITGPLSSYGLGSRTASCSYTDAGGITRSASATFSIVDTIAPSLTVPGDITKEATSGAGATASWTASATDAVDPSPSVVCTPSSGSTFALGTVAVSCTATDEAGNHTLKLFNVIVQDTTGPTLDLPADITKEATGPTGAVATYSATATDAVDGSVATTCAPASGSTFALGTTPVNCSAADSHGNPSTGGFNVNVVDTTKPVLTLPPDFTLEATGPSGAVGTYTATATDAVDGALNVNCDYASGTTFGIGSTTVSCTATDKSSNTATGSFKVTVKDTTPPALTVPADITTEATKPAGADVTYAASASDIVDGVLAPECTPTSGSTFLIGTTTVDCSVTDNAGNPADGSFKVTVTDTTAPVLSGVPADQTLEATGPGGATATFTTPTASDIVDGSTPVSCDATSGDTFPLGITTVTCTSTDAHANEAQASFTITVQDTTPPALADVPGNQTLEATGPSGALATFTNPTASDIVDGVTTVTCDAQSGDTFPLGVTTVKCSTEDNAGNSSDASFTISVNDTTGPVVTVPSNLVKEATGPSGSTATFAASALDTVDGPRPTTCVPPSGSTFALGVTTVTCSASDTHANPGSAGFTVTVQDTTAPSLAVPGDITLEATGPSGAPVSFSVTATDIVDGNVVPDCTAAGDPVLSGDTFAIGATSVSCTATDAHGNISLAKTFTITVQDTTAPDITVPADKTVEATGSSGAVVNYAASASDLVDGSVTPVCSPASGSAFGLGTTTVTCTAIDAHGNQSTASFSVKVQDTTPPVITVPNDITATATSSAGAVVTYTASATDVVSGAVAVTCVQPSGSTFGPGGHTVTCNAMDGAGNPAASKSFTITVVFGFSGFLAPVDNNKTLNGMKAGSTAPMKWQVVSPGGGYISDLGIVKTEVSGTVSCATGAIIDDLSTYATGGTTLRYDSTANQFIYNWQSPKKAGSCYGVTIVLTDGTQHTALFNLK